VISNVTDSYSSAELQQWLDQTNQNQLNSLKATATAMSKFCVANCLDSLGSCRACILLGDLSQLATLFAASPSPTSLVALIRAVVNIGILVEPWTVTQGGTEILLNGNVSAVRQVNRGGTETNLTEQVSYFTQPELAATSNIVSDLGPTFDEYILLSNGVSSSAASIFAYFVSQLWKNKDVSLFQSSVVTCTYGGTSNGTDTTLGASIASVEDVQIQNPFITVGALIMLEALLPLNASTSLSSLRQDFSESLPFPPYFADSLPRLPVVNYYDNFMEPGALPLQYVDMPPDQHLPKLFTAVSLDDSFDLHELYEEASQLFVAVPTPSPFRATPSPAEHPVRPCLAE